MARLEPGAAGTGRAACRLNTGYVIGPSAATEQLAARAMAQGVRFRLGARASVVHAHGRVGGVQAEGKLWPADAVLVCGGAGTSEVVDPSGGWSPIRPLWGVRMDVELLEPLRHVLLDGSVATIQSSAAHCDYAFVLIGTGKRASLGATFLTQEPRVEVWAAPLVERGAERFPALRDAVIGPPRLCARPRSFDGRPLLGETAVRGLYVAAGHGGRGISTGPASARLVASAILDATDDAIPPELRADRYNGVLASGEA